MSVTPDITLDWLLARVVAEEGDDGRVHLIWQGYIQRGHPKANREREAGPFNVRRAVWKAKTGREPRKDRMIRHNCGVFGCVAPDCVEAVPLGEKNRGRRQTLAALANYAKARRARSHLTEQDVAEIRASEEPRDKVGDRYGISGAMVSLIRSYKAWRDYSSPFLGMVEALR